MEPGDFPGGPVVKTPRFHCRGHGVPSLVGELRSYMPRGTAKKKMLWNKTKVVVEPHCEGTKCR